MKTAFLLCSLLFVSFLAATSAQNTIYAIGSATGRLHNFTSTNLGNVFSGPNITNINANHFLRSLDFQPATGTLFVLSSTNNNVAPNFGQIYTVNPENGYLNPIGSTFLLNTTSTSVHMDFNPAANAIRVISADGLSLRVNANTGALIATDSYVVYNGSSTPVTVGGIAYSNNIAGATFTTLYTYDSASANFSTIGSLNFNNTVGQLSPNSGQTFIVGASGITLTTPMGLDIANDGTIYGSDAAGVIYTVNAATGVFTSLGATSLPMLDIAVRLPVPTPSGANGTAVNPIQDRFYAVTTTGILLSINSTSFNNPYAGPAISGIVAGHTFRSIDYQPASFSLWGLSTVVTGTTSNAQLYIVDPVLGYFNPKGSIFNINTTSTSVHIDFNPAANAIRLIASDGFNARINPATLVVTVDGPVMYASTDANANAAINVAQIAYSNNFNGTTTTTLYAYDSALNILTTILPPNNGTQNTVGRSGVTSTTPVGLDISSNGQVWASTNSLIYPVNATTGAFGNGSPIGFAIVDFAVILSPVNITSNTTNTTATTGFTTGLTSGMNMTTGVVAGNVTTGVIGTTGTNFTTGLKATTGIVTTGVAVPTTGSTTEQSSPASMIVASLVAVVALFFLSF